MYPVGEILFGKYYEVEVYGSVHNGHGSLSGSNCAYHGVGR